MMLLCLVSAMQLLIIYVPLRKKNVLAKESDRRPHINLGYLRVMPSR